MERPLLFIGSSTEGLSVANTLASYLASEIEVVVWTDVFDLGDTNIETLFRQLDCSDYAALVATCDDKVRKRGHVSPAARDNILFESGLFMGRLGRKRAFLVCDKNLKLPTDLSGVTVATFDSEGALRDNSLEIAANKIRQAITKAQTWQEVNFLRAYIEFIDPAKVELWHTYAEILRTHYDKIASELDRLRQTNDWRRLLKIKERLREYFEYAGMYREGVEFGRSYVTALQGLGRHFDAAWSQVKDVGYMLILSGNYMEGRSAILKAIDNHITWGSSVAPEQQAQLLFYANRYLAVSYYRDKAGGDHFKARHFLEKAKTSLAIFSASSREYLELNARLLRNQGHLEFEDGKIEIAINCYRQSLALFREIGDIEHIGTSQLSLAKALIGYSNNSLDEAYNLLKSAGTAYSQIGWVEGQARVQEQLARYWLVCASKATRKKTLLQEMQTALDSSQVMFDRIHSGRFQDRLEELRGQLHRALESLNN